MSFDTGFSAEPSFSRSICFEEPLTMLERDITDMSVNGGPKLKQALYDVLGMALHGFNVIPVRLFDYVNCLNKNDFEFSYDINSVARVLANFACCHSLDKAINVNDFAVSYRNTTATLTLDIINNLSIVTYSGIQSIVAGTGINLLDYIVYKYDGVSVRTFNINFGVPESSSIFFEKWLESKNVISFNAVVSYAIVGSRIVTLSEFTVPFAGELIDDYVVACYGANVLLEFSDYIDFDGKRYNVVASSPLMMNTFLKAPMPKNVDGYILSVNGTEYKLKDRYDIDLKYLGNQRAVTRDGGMYQVNLGGMVKEGIVEFDITTGQPKFSRMRPDKCKAQSKLEIELICKAPLISYVKTLFSQFADMSILPYTDMYPMCMLLTVIKDELLLDKTNDFIISPFIFRSILAKKRIIITQLEMQELYQRVSGGVSMQPIRIDREDLKKVRSVKICYATCSSIYEAMLKTGLSNSLYQLARVLVKQLNLIVSVKKLFNMVCRNELLLIGDNIMTYRVAGMECSFVSKVQFRDEDPIEIKDYVMALCEYTKNNESIHSYDTELNHFRLEVEELMECNLSHHTLEEIGDVMTMLVKVCFRMSENKNALFDFQSEIWRILFALPIMTPFIEKMQARILRFGCVRNHDTAIAHRCSSGKFFDPNVYLNDPNSTKLEWAAPKKGEFNGDDRPLQKRDFIGDDLTPHVTKKEINRQNLTLIKKAGLIGQFINDFDPTGVSMEIAMDSFIKEGLHRMTLDDEEFTDEEFDEVD